MSKRGDLVYGIRAFTCDAMIFNVAALTRNDIAIARILDLAIWVAR